MAPVPKEIDKYLGEVEATYKHVMDKEPEMVKNVGEEFTLLYLYSCVVIKYSKKLGIWTIFIAGLTGVLIVLTAVHVFIILNDIFGWF